MRHLFPIFFFTSLSFGAHAQNSKAHIEAYNEHGCQPLTTEFSLEGADENVVWTINGRTLKGNYQRIEFKEAGVYNVSATYVKNGQKVTVTEERLVEVYPNPHPNFEVNASENLLEATPTIGSNYAWYMADGTKIDNESYQLQLSNLSPGEYVIMMEETNSLGCSQKSAPQAVAVLASNN